MKIAVIGAGGVGGYFGGKLAKSGSEVTFVARGEHLNALRENGLKVKSVAGDFVLPKVRATDKIPSVGNVDLVILGIKAWQVKSVAEQLRAIVKAGTTVLPLQNGVLAAGELAEVLDPQNVIGGMCRIISKIESPGVIHHSGLEPFIAFGELDHRTSDRIGTIKALFDQSGISSRIADDIQVELWNKFMAICVSGLLAVTRSTYGVVRELKETRRMMNDLLREIYEIAVRTGLKMDPQIVEKTMFLINSYPYDSTSSLTRDVMAGRLSEIEYQNGTVVRFADQYNMEAPVNRYIYNCILPMELAARAKAAPAAESGPSRRVTATR